MIYVDSMYTQSMHLQVLTGLYLISNLISKENKS